MKVVLIILQIICAVLYGWLGFRHSDKVLRILYVVFAGIWALAVLANAASLAVG